METHFELISFDLVDLIISYLDNPSDVTNFLEELYQYNFFIRAKNVLRLKYGDQLYQNIEKLKQLNLKIKRYSYSQIYLDLLLVDFDEFYSPFGEDVGAFHEMNIKLKDLNDKLYILDRYPHYIKNINKLESRFPQNLIIPHILAEYLSNLENGYINNKKDGYDDAAKFLEPLYKQDILNIDVIDDEYIKYLFSVNFEVLTIIKKPEGGYINWAIPIYIFSIIGGHYRNYDDPDFQFKVKSFFKGQYFYSYDIINFFVRHKYSYMSVLMEYNFDTGMINDDDWIIEE